MKLQSFTILLIMLASQFSVFPQKNFDKEAKKDSCSYDNEQAVREYFEQFKIQQEFISQCESENETRRRSLNFPTPKIISGFNPIAISLVKPYYPKTAKQLRISGTIIVDVFTDENGFVIYSKILKGNSFLRESVRKAACFSKFTPIQYCGKPVKSHYLIRYNFIAD